MGAVLKLKTKLSPRDHGQPITEEDLALRELVPGFKYEVIEGRLYVSYAPDMPEGWVERWLDLKLTLYSLEHPEIINFLCSKARVYVPGRRRGETVPEPDLAAYLLAQAPASVRELDWREVSPLLIVEVFSGADPSKDLIRNVALYERVPSIREYWILDISADPDHPTLRVYRRRGQRWQRPIDIAYGEKYTTKLLPGFTLLLDPRK